ncbi:MAG: family ATPase [Mycetocola sp.]|nr:family ATPase [Mycetocola sp.]
MADYYSYGRVQSVDEASDFAWVEFPNGAMGEVDVSDLDVVEKGTVLRISNDLSDVREAPENAGFPRQFQTVGILEHVEGPRALMSVAGKILAVEAESIVTPQVGGAYVYDDSSRAWTALNDAEANVISGLESEEAMPFNIERLTPADGGIAAVGGLDSKVNELKRLVEASFSSRDSDFRRSGQAKPVSGAIFFGPPGTGKTHLARAVAQETSAQLITVNGPELVSKWVGATERVLRELFGTARRHDRSIIFFDEFDTIGARRGPDTHDFVNRQVGQLLSIMDGAGLPSRPFVIAATNRLEDVDPAFLRPGRFDYPMEFSLPTARERLEILQAQARFLPLVSPEALTWIAGATNAWSPAELGLIWTEAAAKSHASGRDNTSLEHVLFGFERARDQHSLVERTKDAWAAEEAQKA